MIISNENSVETYHNKAKAMIIGEVKCEVPTLTKVTSDGLESIPVSPHRQISSIGSLKTSDLHLAGKGVEPVHCLLLAQEGGYALKNIGQSASVTLNGEKLNRVAPLADGDWVQIGQTLLQFRDRPKVFSSGTEKASRWTSSAPRNLSVHHIPKGSTRLKRRQGASFRNTELLQVT